MVKNFSWNASSIIKFITIFVDENDDEEPFDAVELKSGEVCVFVKGRGCVCA